MSVMRCDFCDIYVDTDWDVEHFNEEGNCIDVDNGDRYFDGQYAVDTIEKNGQCAHCKTPLKADTEAIGELDADGDFMPWERWCSWDCISAMKDRQQHATEHRVDRKKLEVRTGMTDMDKREPLWGEE